ncbi:MAG TPA: MarR family transcriptional regulator [Nitrolancea sp.]|jgi:DNA-binding MarR family transcriptional regulator|nr:MarR family transcriptional regulator [Nitrolancea sp.]
MEEPEFRPTGGLDLLRWIGWAQRKAAEDWIRARELSFEQGFALGFVQENPGSIQRDIATMTRTSAASVSSLLQGLERRGLIERRTEDGDERSKRVYPTAAGSELIAGFEAAMGEANDSILEPLTEPERTTLFELLGKITAALPQPTRS